jgi:hypothetical protein
MEEPMERDINLCTKVHSSHNSNGGPKELERYSSILTLAVRRASEAIQFFEERGAFTERVPNKSFFLYVSVKKDAQRVIIEKIGHSMGIELDHGHFRPRKYADDRLTNSVFENDFNGIFEIIQEIAADEVEFYLAHAEMEKNGKIRSLLFMLADLAKEFLLDIKLWRLYHKSAPDSSPEGICNSAPRDYAVSPALN